MDSLAAVVALGAVAHEEVGAEASAPLGGFGLSRSCWVGSRWRCGFAVPPEGYKFPWSVLVVESAGRLVGVWALGAFVLAPLVRPVAARLGSVRAVRPLLLLLLFRLAQVVSERTLVPVPAWSVMKMSALMSLGRPGCTGSLLYT